MKGDKGVERLQVISYGPLFFDGRHRYYGASDKLFIEIVDRTTGCECLILIEHLICSKHMAKELQVKQFAGISNKKPTVVNTAIYPHNIRFSETHRVRKNQISRLNLSRLR